MNREELLNLICQTIIDYRSGNLNPPTPEHVDKWVSQFELDDQLPILMEMNHVLKKTYFSARKVTDFLSNIISFQELVGFPRITNTQTAFRNLTEF